MDDDSAESSRHFAAGSGLACNACRRRKLRCSREHPDCQQCRKTGCECVYGQRRAKPGMKAGAIDNVHRRLDGLERTIKRQQDTLDSLQREASKDRATEDSNPQNVLSSLIKGLEKLNGNIAAASHEQQGAPSKRRRLDPEAIDGWNHDFPALPDAKVLDEMFKAYFSHVHPWIPMVHEARLRRRLTNDADFERLHIVLCSMVLVSSRYIQDDMASQRLSEFEKQSPHLRDVVVSQAMKHLSVESLQALTIIAFDHIGNGEASHAWPIVGSLSRMVEYLQLTTENNDDGSGGVVERQSFSEPYTILQPPRDWTEAEERRRVFWNIFNLDRLCSLSMGWNTSLTSEDVHRRLPCDGITWRKEDPVVTPFFGIWDTSAGRIGKTIAFLPEHPTLLQTSEVETCQTPSVVDSPVAAATSSAGVVDMSTVGAFAYCIEATESLSRVTNYFLRQRVNTRDQGDLGSWLTRFKELDLRLVHWKMLLPQKWKVNIGSTKQQQTKMDPNLTLAHVTHNASMILLHQPIVFPPKDWPFAMRLPSLCSVDTCQAAAVEISIITDHYLKSTSTTLPLNSQFAFCVYMAARVLLLLWRHHKSTESLSEVFWLLISCLDSMAERWAGVRRRVAPSNLAAKYSSVLSELHAKCIKDASFAISVPGYTNEVRHCSTEACSDPVTATYSKSNDGSHDKSPVGETIEVQVPVARDANSISSRTRASRSRAGPSAGQALSNQHTPIDLASAIVPMQQTPSQLYGNNINLLGGTDVYIGGGMDNATDIGDISQMFLGQQFTDMDRIISYDDGLFEAQYDGSGW